MPETAAFMDSSCPQCRRRIGWFGRAIDMPVCPGCGAKPNLAALQADQAEIDSFRELLGKLRDRNATYDQLGRARVAAGLTLIQAAKQFGVSATLLSIIEQGLASPTREFAARMSECYGAE